MIREFAAQTCHAHKDLNRSEDKPMFLYFAGNHMTASNAAISVRKALDKSGVLASLYQKDSKFTSTMVRKLITTLIREEEPELVGPLFQQLGHSESTSAWHYQLKMSQKSSAHVVKNISTILSKAADKEKEEGLIRIQSRNETRTPQPPLQENSRSGQATSIEKDTTTPAEHATTEEETTFERMLALNNSKKGDNLVKIAVKMNMDLKDNPVGTMLEGRRYRLISEFETVVKRKYDIELSPALGHRVPKAFLDPSL